MLNLEKAAKLKHLKETNLRIKALEDLNPQENVLEGVKVNGSTLTADASKAVNITVATGEENGNINVNGSDVAVKGLTEMAYKSEIAKTDLAAALQNDIDAKAAAANVYTKTEVDGIVSAVYKPGGSVAFASLPALGASVLGKVYNVTDEFTTTADFVEGADKTHPAGTNVVIIEKTPAVPESSEGAGDGQPAVYAYDVLAGFVDLSGHVEKETGKSLMLDTDKTKLDAIAENATKVESSTTNGYIKINGTETKVVDIATDEEFEEMMTEIYGASGSSD